MVQGLFLKWLAQCSDFGGAQRNRFSNLRLATNEVLFIIKGYNISILVTIFRLHSKSTISARVSGSKLSRVRTVLPGLSGVIIEVSSQEEDGLAPSTISLLRVEKVLVSFADRRASCKSERLSDNAGLWSVDDHRASYMSGDMIESWNV